MKLANVVPFGRDVYLSLMKDNISISYRGVYNEYQHARAAVSKKSNKEYDLINRNKAANEEQELKGLENWFNDFDYPLLFWLSKLVTTQSRVLELGGSVGHFFYTIQRLHEFPTDIVWTIAELPEAVRLGAKIAKDREEKRLSFIDSANIDTVQPSKVFVSAGTLQYMNESLPAILGKLQTLPDHVLIHNLPCHHNRSFWTLQNLKICEVPYYIYNLQKLKSEMEKLGYQITAEWTRPRNIEIPFHRDLKVMGYLGFYFRRR